MLLFWVIPPFFIVFLIARMSHASRVIEWIQQIYATREGVILPVPWCDSFNFQLENIFTRLSIVPKEKACRKVTNEVTSITVSLHHIKIVNDQRLY